MANAQQSGLAVVASFAYLHEADVAKALLDAHGITAWILDEHQIQLRWYLAGAFGGVKVAVDPQQATRAREILREDQSDALREIPEQGLPTDPVERCPQCGAAAGREVIHKRYPGPIQWLVSLLFFALGLLVPRRRFDVERTCELCGFQWSVQENR
jgi:hypothetical protein